MSVAVKKIPGVEAVQVSLNHGMAAIQLAPVNHVSLQQVRQAIRSQGFNARDARVAAVGRLQLAAGRLEFKVSGSPDVLTVMGTPHASWTRYGGKTEWVHGLVPAGTGALSIQITSVSPPGVGK